MKKVLLITAIALSGLLVAPVHADTGRFTTCLLDSLNGKERKNLAKWIYFSIAAHPELNEFSNISKSDRTSIDKYTGQLVTRLLVEDCAQELVAAQKADPLAIEKAFEMVGQVAMQELMNSEDVTNAITNYLQYTDQDKLNQLFTE
ncbi:hypothetical protein [Vibrio sp. ZOR0018]|uniref:hypothetical protein n=1 Tax=Vibrio sp. ZOR0018 TaxID=1339225 RepID=UPI00064609B7|nr:hypothetical protein [Vibrio sp. ZOR0018]